MSAVENGTSTWAVEGADKLTVNTMLEVPVFPSNFEAFPMEAWVKTGSERVSNWMLALTTGSLEP